jgi:hypothetical protein
LFMSKLNLIIVDLKIKKQNQSKGAGRDD